MMVAYSAVIVLIYMTIFFIIAKLIKNNSIVDIGWGLGFVTISLITLFISGNLNIRSILVTTLVFVWGTRLAYYIFKRNKGKPEDFRYAKWREEWGKWRDIRAFFQIFMLQGTIMLIVAYPIILNNSTATGAIGVVEILGLMIWVFGFGFEVIGDYQLKRFKANKNNKGRIIKEGLWRYTRHPNYFGEAVLWWGIFLICLPSNSGIIGIMSPILMTYLLMFVSGVPMLENHYKDHYEYQEYAKVTNKFFPWVPKKQA